MNVNRILALLAFVAVVSIVANGSASDDENSRVTAPSEEMVKKISEAIRTHCPDAKIEVTKNMCVAKNRTMQFTVHNQSMTGDFSRETHQEEGPNATGFMLQVALRDGKYRGQAGVPQTLHGPYFPTFIDAPVTADGKQYYWVSFKYGSNLDPKLKQAILDVIPRTKFAKPAP